ncbi:nucleoside-diphosphate-sugar epimerase [Campylobacter iguaniorum]|uniref:NAD-dependent epimerase/dehydratase family protein n=1 Tax=Campylobacter iguaniorum TaxID=1244531 RepID=UPI00073A7A4E|nr:NAD-dependent epimerase/dehydratase family protein [Campylobacter iguaniorum]ALV23660.1 nucleoside-diphosphate-sugar epimerase [Campylobacter iguaniorum]
MKFLVTGGAGFIGSAIAKKLFDRGDSVLIIDNLSTGYIENIPENVDFIEGDFSKDDIILQLDNQKFDGIFHIGGQSSGEISFENPEYDLNTNTLSTIKLLQYAVKTGCKKIVYASSMSVYGEHFGKECFSEDDLVSPKSFYAVGKLASERYMDIFSKQFGINYVALRYFNVYGPGQNLQNLKQGMVSIYLKQFIDDKFDEVTIKGSVDRFRDLIYIDDIVDITINSMDNPNFNNQVINIGTGKKTTVANIINLIKQYTNIDKKIILTDGTPGDQFGIYANNTKLTSLYPYPLVNFAGIGGGVRDDDKMGLYKNIKRQTMKILFALSKMALEIISYVSTSLGVRLRYYVYRHLYKKIDGFFYIGCGCTITGYKYISLGKNVSISRNSFLYSV